MKIENEQNQMDAPVTTNPIQVGKWVGVARVRVSPIDDQAHVLTDTELGTDVDPYEIWEWSREIARDLILLQMRINAVNVPKNDFVTASI
jgi:hypothetical protein